MLSKIGKPWLMCVRLGHMTQTSKASQRYLGCMSPMSSMEDLRQAPPQLSIAANNSWHMLLSVTLRDTSSP